MSTKYILHTDGASKGNPGPAGIGVALYRDGEDEPMATLAEYIGETTNNVAEYRALIRGLSEALTRGAERIEARTDSEVVARQIAGQYKVSSPQIATLFAEAKELLARFASATVVHVPRAQNALADKLANQGVAEEKARKADAAATTAAPPAKKSAATKKTVSPPAPKATPPKKKETTPAPVSAKVEPQFANCCITEENGERIIYDVERLWELAKSLPVRTIPLSQVEGVLDVDCWFGGKAPTARQVAKHAKRIYEADFSRPILIGERGNLFDGAHRIARAWLEGKTHIDAVQLGDDLEPDYRGQVTPKSDKPKRRRKAKP